MTTLLNPTPSPSSAVSSDSAVDIHQITTPSSTPTNGKPSHPPPSYTSTINHLTSTRLTSEPASNSSEATESDISAQGVHRHGGNGGVSHHHLQDQQQHHHVLPPWRLELEESINCNTSTDNSHLFASLATIKPYGRPANRSVFFRGFLSDFYHPPTPTSSPILEKIHNVLVFVADARSGSIDDIIHGSRFGEICWFMPGTKEQFRISGQVHIVVSEEHKLATLHRVPRPFSELQGLGDVKWEELRMEVWRRLSSVRRASFTWPAPGKPSVADGHVAAAETDVLGGNVATLQPPSLCSLITHLDAEVTPASPASTSKSKHHHMIAMSNFCLLLLDVDGADHLRMASIPHVRTKFRRSVEAWSEDHLEDLFMQYGGDIKETGVATEKVHQHAASRDAQKCGDLVETMSHWSIKEVNP